MIVRFDETTHTYWLGERKLPSVTQLLKKHGLSTNYAGVDAAVLSRAAQKGTLVHKEIEEYIKTGDVGFTSELADFISICERIGFVPEESEILLPAYDIAEEEADDIVFAGTADIIGHIGEKSVLVDVKTTAAVNKHSGAWQLSLYERLAGVKFDEMYICHLCDKSKEIAIHRIPAKEIDRLIECELNDEIYKEPALDVEKELVEQLVQAELEYKEAKAVSDKAEKKAKALRATLCEIMEDNGRDQYETPDKRVLFTRVPPSASITCNIEKLAAVIPDWKDKYGDVKVSAGYVKATVRKGE